MPSHLSKDHRKRTGAARQRHHQILRRACTSTLGLALLALCPTARSSPPSPQAYKSTLLAGAPALSYQDGPAKSAAFASPTGMTVDADGNLFIADTNNRCIRKLTPAGIVSTYAGSPTPGELVDGPLATARFRGPLALAFDSMGNLLVADIGAVRVISPAGVVSTLSTEVQPSGIAVAPDGTIYVAEGGYAAIRRLARDGTLTVVAGAYGTLGDVDGPALQARFRWAGALALDVEGNLYVADTNNQSVRKISAAGTVTTLMRNVLALGVAVDRAGNVYAAEGGSYLWRMAPGAAMRPWAGTGMRGYVDGGLASAQLYSARSVAVDHTGNVYFGDDTLIRRITPAGLVVTVAGLPGGSSTGDGDANSVRFFAPGGAAFDATGNLYVTESGSHVIRKVAPTGAVTLFAGTPGHSGSQGGDRRLALFDTPAAVTVTNDNTIYIGDRNGIRKIAPSGTVSSFPIGYGINGARGIIVTGFAHDANDNVYFADNGNLVVGRISRNGILDIIAGGLGQRGFVNGPAANARFAGFAGIAAGSDNSVYVLDAGNQAIRIISPGGVVSSRAVSIPFERIGSGTGLSDPPLTGMLVEPNGELVVMSQRLLHRLLPTGEWRQVAGMPVPLGTPGLYGGDGWYLRGLSRARDGSWLVIDPYNGSVRRLELRPPSELLNLSTRAAAGADAAALIAGFTTAGEGVRPVLVRAIGPGLEPFGVDDLLPDPSLLLFDPQGRLEAENDDWGGTATLSTAFASTGAFDLPPASRDAAVSIDVSRGSHTAHVRGTRDGIALVEVYAGTGDGVRLTNLSARAPVGPAVPIFAGFAISGEVRKAVLIRGVGSGLSSLGMSGLLNGVTLTLFDSAGRVVATNSGWGGVSRFSDAFRRVGAFPLPPPDYDAALLVDLEPGTYNVRLSSSYGGSGLAMVEIYDADP